MKHAAHRLPVRILIAVLVVTLVAGCTLLSPVQVETRKGVLDQIPVEIPQRITHTSTLLVLPPETNPTYNTTQMAYTIRPYQVDFFTQHEWSATPAQMLQPLLIKTLENTHYFIEVLTPPYPGNYTYALRTQIVELSQNFTTEPAAARLSLRVQLINGATSKIIAHKVIELREPMQHKNSYSGVVAANTATAKALHEIAKFVLEKSNIAYGHE